jgi:hypothetical protein
LVEEYRDMKFENNDKASEDNGTKPKGKRKKQPKDHYLSHLNEVAIGLYKTLSTNIHHYSGDLDLHNSELGQLQGDILRALVRTGLNKDLDLDEERKRLGYIAEIKVGKKVEEDGNDKFGLYNEYFGQRDQK